MHVVERKEFSGSEEPGGAGSGVVDSDGREAIVTCSSGSAIGNCSCDLYRSRSICQPSQRGDLNVVVAGLLKYCLRHGSVPTALKLD
jgi:hypothetical protein